MTNHKTIKGLRYLANEFSGYKPNEEMFEMAIKVLEKQIPKKPVKSKEPRYGMGYAYYDWECPSCGGFLVFEPDLDRLRKIHHCRCGQALTWEDES